MRGREIKREWINNTVPIKVSCSGKLNLTHVSTHRYTQKCTAVIARLLNHADAHGSVWINTQKTVKCSDYKL